MQRPTVSNVRIRSTADAHLIFHAVATRRLPMITRRLDADERKAIASGCVYVWEERTADSDATGMGIERWTDSFRWGPSRVRDDFLFYQEKDPDPDDEPQEKESRWARMMRRRSQPPMLAPSQGSTNSGSTHKRPPADPERMVKQTYSVLVEQPGTLPGRQRKWHLTAYFTQASIDGLGIVDDIAELRNLIVPPGMYKSARNGKQHKRRDDPNRRSTQEATIAPLPLTIGDGGPGQYSFPASPYPAFAGYVSEYPNLPPLAVGTNPAPLYTTRLPYPPNPSGRYTSRGGPRGPQYTTSNKREMSPSPILRSPQEGAYISRYPDSSGGFSSGYSSNSSNDHSEEQQQPVRRQRENVAATEPSLVPLEILSNLPSGSRNPEDERVLRQLTHSNRKPGSGMTLSKATFS